MNKIKLVLVIFSVSILNTYAAGSKPQQKPHLVFDLSKEWTCSTDDKVHTCSILGEDKKIYAVIIVAAKEQNKNESITTYFNKLKKESKDVKIHSLSGHMWVDAKKINTSNVPKNYIAREMITTQDGIAMMVSMSAHKDLFSKYEPDFMTVINTIKAVN